MAIKKETLSTKLILKLQKGTDKNGQPEYTQRSVANINPAISDDDFSAIGTGIAALQALPVAAVERQDNAALVNED
jgi:hypothetical protein